MKRNEERNSSNQLIVVYLIGSFLFFYTLPRLFRLFNPSHRNSRRRDRSLE